MASQFFSIVAKTLRGLQDDNATTNSQSVTPILVSPFEETRSDRNTLLVFFKENLLGQCLYPLYEQSKAEPDSNEFGSIEIYLYSTYKSRVSESTRDVFDQGDATIRLEKEAFGASSSLFPSSDSCVEAELSNSTALSTETLPLAFLRCLSRRWKHSIEKAQANLVDSGLFTDYVLHIVPGWCAIAETHKDEVFPFSFRHIIIQECLLPTLSILKRLVFTSLSGTSSAEMVRGENSGEPKKHITGCEWFRFVSVQVAIQQALYLLQRLLISIPLEAERDDSLSLEQAHHLSNTSDLHRQVIKDTLPFLSFFSHIVPSISGIGCGVAQPADNAAEIRSMRIITASFCVVLSIVSAIFPASESIWVTDSIELAVDFLLDQLLNALHNNFSSDIVDCVLTQLSSAIQILSLATEINAAGVVRVLNDSQFRIRMPLALSLLGSRYTSPAANANEQSKLVVQMCESQLHEFVKLPSSNDKEGKMVLQSVDFLCSSFAETAKVNEFLGSFFSLSHLQRSMLDNMSNSRTLDDNIIANFFLTDSIVMNSLQAEGLDASKHEKNNEVEQGSCSKYFFCVYLVDLVSLDYLSNGENIIKEKWRHLANLGVYDLLLNNEEMRREINGDSRILFAVMYTLDRVRKLFSGESDCMVRAELFTSILKFAFNSLTTSTISESCTFPEGITIFSLFCSLACSFLLPTTEFKEYRQKIVDENFDEKLISLLLDFSDPDLNHAGVVFTYYDAQWAMTLFNCMLESGSVHRHALQKFCDRLLRLMGCEEICEFASGVLIHLLHSYTSSFASNSLSDHGPLEELRSFSNAFYNVISIEVNNAVVLEKNYKKVLSMLKIIRTALGSIDYGNSSTNIGSRCVLQHYWCMSSQNFLELINQVLVASMCVADLGVVEEVTRSSFCTLLALVRGQTECREQLKKAVSFEYLFQTFKKAFTTTSYKLIGVALIVENFIRFAYEYDGVFVNTDLTDERRRLILFHPEILFPVMNYFLADSSNFQEHGEVFEMLLEKLIDTAKASITEALLISKAGFVLPLAKILVLSHEEPSKFGKVDMLRGRLSLLLSLIMVRQLNVTDLKHFLLLTLVQVEHPVRQSVLLDIVKILNAATHFTDEKLRNIPASIILRPESGHLGIRAELPNGVTDGYTVTMWICFENYGYEKNHTLFAIEDRKGRTLLRSFVNRDDNFCVEYLGRSSTRQQLPLGKYEKSTEWLHVAFTHQRPRLLQSDCELAVYINGNSVATSTVRFPYEQNICFLYVGTSGTENSPESVFTGQIGEVLFFPKALNQGEIENLRSSPSPWTNRPLPFLKGMCNTMGSCTAVSPLQYALVDDGMENLAAKFSEKGMILLHPTVGITKSLYNAATLLNRSFSPDRVFSFEGNLFHRSPTGAGEALCLIDAINGCFIPILSFLLDSRLPFPTRLVGLPNASVCSSPSSGKKNLILKHLLEIILSLCLYCEEFRETFDSSGFVYLLSFALERLAPTLPSDIPEILMNICQCFSDIPARFNRIISSLFLSPRTIHNLSICVQQEWWHTQIHGIHSLPKLGPLLREAEVQAFIVEELLYTMASYGEAERQSLHEELFSLLELLIVTPATQSNAVCIIYLIRHAQKLAHERPELEPCFSSILSRCRILMYSSSYDLTKFLARNHFFPVVYSFLSSSNTSVRNEGVRMSCLLVQRCIKIQHIMNPPRDTAGVDVVCTLENVELGWLADKLQRFPVTMEMYLTLRAILTGEEDTRGIEMLYTPVNSSVVKLESCLPHVLPSLIQLASCGGLDLQVKALEDISKIILSDKRIPRKISSLTEWYSCIEELYAKVITCRNAPEADLEGINFTIPHQCSQEYRSIENFDEQHLDHQGMLMTALRCAGFSIGACLLQTVVHDSFGDREYRKVCGYLMLHGSPTLLCYALQHVMVGLEGEMKNSDPDNANILYKNFACLCHATEEYLFYCRQHVGPKRPGKGDVIGVGAAAPVIMEYDEKCQLFMTSLSDWVESDEEKTWLHLPLALHLCQLLAIYKFGLYLSEDMGAERTVGSDTLVEEDRAGSLSALFLRLMRVAASFTLRNAKALDILLEAGTSFCKVVSEKEPLWMRQIRISSQWTDLKCHTTIGNTMVLFYLFHDILNRRLRMVPLSEENAVKVNTRLITILRELFFLFSSQFSQLTILAEKNRGDEIEGKVRRSTSSWLSDVETTPTMQAYVEVASRSDYNDFVTACFTVMRKSRKRDEIVAARLHHRIHEQHDELVREAENARNVHRCIHSAVNDYVSAESSCLVPLSEGSLPVNDIIGISKAPLQTLRNTAWSCFRLRINGSMWRPKGEETGCWRLTPQASLYRRKIWCDEGGVNYRDAIRQQLDPNDGEEEVNSGTTVQRSRMRLTRQKWLSNDAQDDSEHEDIEWEGEEEVQVESSMDADCESERKALNVSGVPCELVYLLHSWSASLSIENNEVSIIIAEKNEAKNSKTVKEAEKYLTKPESTRFLLSSIVELVPGRRYRMQRTALEIVLRNQEGLLLNFPSKDDMSRFVKLLVSSIRKAPDIGEPPYVFATHPQKEPRLTYCQAAWLVGAISNFDYLMALNFFAGRTVLDISQYPVFPWVLKNYGDANFPDLENEASFRDLCKPIGAIGSADKELIIQARYAEQVSMGDVPSHYFSHYSSPFAVASFLIRLEPFTSLHLLLQGGTFDFADRLFHSVPAAFQGVLKNIQDVRELIPEFYFLPEMCFNHNDIAFGKTSNRMHMHDLVLPPWANDCPYQFIYRMREALESDYVSNHLHLWIDLIFGSKQRGEAAVKAVNVFQCFTYESVMRGNLNEPGMLEFCDNMGQTPIQLFKVNHPPRQKNYSLGTKIVLEGSLCVQWLTLNRYTVPSLLTMWYGNKVIVLGGSEGISSYLWPFITSQLQSVFPLDTDDVAEIERSSTSFTLGTEGLIPETLSLIKTAWKSVSKPSSPDGSSEGNSSLPDCSQILFFKEHQAIFTVHGGILCNALLIRHFNEIGGIRHRPIVLPGHRDQITHIAVSEDSAYFASGGKDSTIMVWHACYSPRGGLRVKFHFFISKHEYPCSAVALSSSLDIVVTASVDGAVLMHSLSGCFEERRISYPTNGCCVNRILVQAECYVPNILLASDQDECIHQMSLNGVPLRHFYLPGKLRAWCCGVKQYVVLACSSHESGTPASLQGKNASIGEGQYIFYLHSFFLLPLKRICLPTLAAVRTMSLDCSTEKLDAVVLGTDSGHLGIITLT